MAVLNARRDTVAPTLAVSLLWMMLAGCLPVLAPPAGQAYKSGSGPYAVCQETHTWHDAATKRDLAVCVYRPAGEGETFPAVVFSPGCSIPTDHYTYLGQHWASNGYVVALLGYPDSDLAFLKGCLNLQTRWKTLEDPAIGRRRLQDVSFAIDQLETDPSLRDVVDIERIGVGGHSLGALSAMAAVGMRVGVQDAPDSRIDDPRVKAAVALSPPAPALWGLTEDSLRTIDRPCQTIMGTLDVDFVVTFHPTERRIAFDNSDGPDQFLVTLLGAVHTSYEDRLSLLPQYSYRNCFHDYIEMATLAFFDAYLKDDREAQQWLAGGRLELCAGGNCKLECKNVTLLESH